MKSLIKSWFHTYNATGKFWLALALGALLVDAVISFMYGVSITFAHGAGFALVAVFFALLPDAAYTEIENKRVVSGIVIAAICIPLGAVAFQSHLGYGASVRLGDMQQTNVSNAKFDDVRESLKSEKSDKARWEKQLDDLKAANAWLPTVTANALRTQVEIAQKDIDLEAARKGCKQKCRERMKDKADLEGRIATAEKVEDLTKQIEATQRIIDKKTAEVAQAKYTSSAVVNQNNVVAQLFLALSGATAEQSINPDATTASFTSIGLAGAGSLAFMLMAPVGFFVAGRNRKQGCTIETLMDMPKAITNAAISKTNTVVHRLDDTRTATAIRQAIAESYGKHA